jgi:hypothetical protein
VFAPSSVRVFGARDFSKRKVNVLGNVSFKINNSGKKGLVCHQANAIRQVVTVGGPRRWATVGASTRRCGEYNGGDTKAQTLSEERENVRGR